MGIALVACSPQVRFPSLSTPDAASLAALQNKGSGAKIPRSALPPGAFQAAWPVPNHHRLVSSFGYRSSNFHEGIDIPAAEGTDAVAVLDGRIVYAGSGMRGFGKLIVLQSGNLYFVYGHNSKLLAKKGDQVQRGQTLCEIGQTGNAASPHLHFETRIRDEKGFYRAFDPIVLFTSR